MQVIRSSIFEKSNTEIILEQKIIDTAVEAAICSIKNELPEEARTVEVMEYIIAEMHEFVKQSKIVL